jgi:hypothetical protein
VNVPDYLTYCFRESQIWNEEPLKPYVECVHWLRCNRR